MSGFEQSAPGNDSGAVRSSSDLDEVSLGARSAVAGMLRVSLRWEPGAGRSQPRLRRQLSRPQRPSSEVRLDLGCLYQFTDGQRGVIQAVGNRTGDYTRAPYIRMDRGVERTDQAPHESISINMDKGAHFSRILIFAMVAGGTDDISRVGAVVTIHPASGPALEIRLEAGDLPVARSSAVAQILWRDDDVVLRRELRYFTGYQSEIDRFYRWGLHWGPGPSKTFMPHGRARAGTIFMVQEIPVVIYVADESVHERVETAVEQLLTDAGFETVYRDDPVLGSWFRKSGAALRYDGRSSVLRDALHTAAHAADSRLVLAQDATVTATLVAGLSPLIAALQPTKDAAVRVGALLVVKVDWAVGVHQLTASQQLQLDHNPQLVASPKELIDVLQLAPPHGERGDESRASA